MCFGSADIAIFTKWVLQRYRQPKASFARALVNSKCKLTGRYYHSLVCDLHVCCAGRLAKLPRRRFFARRKHFFGVRKHQRCLGLAPQRFGDGQPNPDQHHVDANHCGRGGRHSACLHRANAGGSGQGRVSPGSGNALRPFLQRPATNAQHRPYTVGYKAQDAKQSAARRRGSANHLHRVQPASCQYKAVHCSLRILIFFL